LKIVAHLTEKYTANKNGSRIKEWQAQQWSMHFDHTWFFVQNTIFKNWKYKYYFAKKLFMSKLAIWRLEKKTVLPMSWWFEFLEKEFKVTNSSVRKNLF
jgi:hypothetical protein